MKIIAIWIGKLALLATRILHLGSGTTIPGLVAEKIDPNIIQKLSKNLKNGAVVVTGTNGKTTTAKLLTEILFDSGFTVLHNPSGSNLTRGVASAFIHASSLFGNKLHADVAVFEVDEATMPELTTKIRPNLVLVTNLFRDQLDRYGELDKTASIIGSSLRGFPNMSVVLNGDDPLVTELALFAEGGVTYFGLKDTKINSSSKAAMDSKDCLECGHELNYGNRYFGHLGSWDCPNCGKERPKLSYSANNVELSPRKTNVELDLRGEKATLEVQVPGLYNVYNVLAAAAAATALGVGTPAITQAVRDFTAAFGRMEVLSIDGRETMLLLAKNPTGANQSLVAIYSDDKPKTIVLALNDNFADGTDVSWIWDVDFECFDLTRTNFVATGIRAEDMALRLKYAGVSKKHLAVEKDLKKAVQAAVKLSTASETIFVIPTYTAMMEIRSQFATKDDELGQLGKVTKRGL